MSLGLSLPSVTGQLLQGTSWDSFPWAFCRSGEQGNTLLLSFLTQACASQASHYSCPGQGRSWSLFRQCWHGMGVRSSALCSAPHSPQPISQGSTGKAKSPFPWHQDAANACATGVGRVVPVAPVLLSWLQAHPSVWALHVQKHFTLQGRVSGVVGVAGREVQGAALFQL